jgi:hypothetical protein
MTTVVKPGDAEHAEAVANLLQKRFDEPQSSFRLIVLFDHFYSANL